MLKPPMLPACRHLTKVSGAFHRLDADKRILTTDWSKYDGKKHCVFEPALMSPRQLEAAEIKLAGFSGRLTLTRDAVTVEGRAGSSAGLLDQFLAFLRKFGGVGEPKALPPAS